MTGRGPGQTCGARQAYRFGGEEIVFQKKANMGCFSLAAIPGFWSNMAFNGLDNLDMCGFRGFWWIFEPYLVWNKKGFCCSFFGLLAKVLFRASETSLHFFLQTKGVVLQRNKWTGGCLKQRDRKRVLAKWMKSNQTGTLGMRRPSYGTCFLQKAHQSAGVHRRGYHPDLKKRNYEKHRKTNINRYFQGDPATWSFMVRS